MAVGRVVASRSPSATIRSSGRPVISATRSGGNSAMRSRNASQPTRVLARGTPRPRAPRRTTTCSRPSASAASVPGQRREVLVGLRGGARADRVDRRRRARRCLRAARDELPQVVAARERVRAPQQDQLATCANASGSMPGRGAGRVASAPSRPAIEQMLTSCAAGAEHVPQPRAGAALEPLEVAERAGALERPDRLAAVLVADRVQPRRRSRRAPRPSEIRSNRPSPLRADAPQRVQQPVGRARVLEVAR